MEPGRQDAGFGKRRQNNPAVAKLIEGPIGSGSLQHPPLQPARSRLPTLPTEEHLPSASVKLRPAAKSQTSGINVANKAVIEFRFAKNAVSSPSKILSLSTHNHPTTVRLACSPARDLPVALYSATLEFTPIT